MSTEVPPIPTPRRARARRVILVSLVVVVIVALTAGVFYLAQRVREMHAELMQTASLVEEQFGQTLNLLNSDPLLDPNAGANGDPDQWKSVDPNDVFQLHSGDLAQEMAAIESYLDQLLGVTQPQPRALPPTHAPQPSGPAQQDSSMSVAIAETGGAYVIEADMPGVADGAIQVSIEDDKLTITGRRAPAAARGRNAKFHIEERDMRDYHRVIPMFGPVDESGLKAHYENGVLTVIVPKLKENNSAQPIRNARS